MEYYSPPIAPRHWAIPENPEAVGIHRYDGGNASFRDILNQEELAAGRPIYTHVKRPLSMDPSMDPFLAMRFIHGIDKEADWALSNPNSRTREIIKHVGLGPLLRFMDNEDNSDFDNEFIQLMSHPDTHAAYNRAYLESGKPTRTERRFSTDQKTKTPRPLSAAGSMITNPAGINQ